MIGSVMVVIVAAKVAVFIHEPFDIQRISGRFKAVHQIAGFDLSIGGFSSVPESQIRNHQDAVIISMGQFFTVKLQAVPVGGLHDVS